MMSVRDAHLAFETLSDLADGELDASARSAAESHLATCEACTAQLARLHRLLTRAAAAPLEIAPPEETWSAVRARIAADAPSVAAASAAPSLWRRLAPRERGWLAAAALLLVAGTSVVTLALARRQPSAVVAESREPRAESARPGTRPVSSIEAPYQSAVAELQAALDASRARLDARTIATVERSLHTIDAAIAEGREALARDPGDVAVADLLAASYERKLELLRRAVAIPSQS